MKANRQLHYPSEFIWEASIQAVKDSINFISMEDFQKHLYEVLPQNSVETRNRYAGYITKRYFPDGSLDNLITRVWRNYQDENILKDLMRYQFLERESLFGEFVSGYLSSTEAGTIISRPIVCSFLRNNFASDTEKLMGRLLQPLTKLGFIRRSKGLIIVARLPPANTAFFILLHHLFAIQPRVVSISEILANPFWKYLGFTSESDVRRRLKEMAAVDLVSRYTIADQLEQITTRYSLAQILQQRIRA